MVKLSARKKAPSTELREAAPASMRERVICAVVFGCAAIVGILIWRAAITFKSSQWWYLWPLVALTSAAVGALRGPSIFSNILTKSLVEAVARALLIFSESVIEAVILSMLIESFEVALAGDPFGGLLKLMLILPYGPWNGIVAAIFSLWLTTPLALVCGVLLYRSDVLGADHGSIDQ